MTDCIYININGRTVLYLYICMYYINIVVGATPTGVDCGACGADTMLPAETFWVFWGWALGLGR
jgi:hypothetical protein